MGNITSTCVANATNKDMYVKVDVEKIYLNSIKPGTSVHTPAGEPIKNVLINSYLVYYRYSSKV